jgi:hypothetical protein
MNTTLRAPSDHAPVLRFTGEDRRKPSVQPVPQNDDLEAEDFDSDPARGIVLGMLGGFLLWVAILIPLWAVFF